MRLRSRFKLTSLELTSLCLLAVGITLTVTLLTIRSCNNSSTNAVAAPTTTDSIISQLNATRLLPQDSVTAKSRRKTKKRVKQSSSPTQPVSRNHLDEIVNE